MYFIKVVYRLSVVLLTSLIKYRYVFLTKILEVYYYFKPSQIPKTQIEEIVFPNDFFINKENHKKGNVTELESKTIAHLVRYFKPEVIFELGTFNGFSTLNMAMNSPNESRIYTLDLPQELLTKTGMEVDVNEKAYIKKEVSGSFFINSAVANRITQLYGDSYSFDFSPYYGNIDFVFIDASHTYKYVKNDTEIALKLLREKGGVILWHDYNSVTFKGVTRFLDEMFVGDARFKEMKLIKGTSLTLLNLKNES